MESRLVELVEELKLVGEEGSEPYAKEFEFLDKANLTFVEKRKLMVAMGSAIYIYLPELDTAWFLDFPKPEAGFYEFESGLSNYWGHVDGGCEVGGTYRPAEPKDDVEMTFKQVFCDWVLAGHPLNWEAEPLQLDSPGIVQVY